MTIPETLSARRAELEADIANSETEAALFRYQADQQRAELRGINLAIEAYAAADIQTAVDMLTVERTRRPLRKMVLDFIERSTMGSLGPIPTKSVCEQFVLNPARAAAVIGYWCDQGKITGDNNGWCIVRGETAALQLAAE